MKRHVGITAVVLAAGLGLAACASLVRGQPVTHTSAGPASTSAAGRSTPVVGMLQGTSPADHGLGRARMWSDDAWLVAAAAGRARAQVVLDRCGDGPTSSNVTYDGRVMSTTGQNGLIKKTELHNAEGDLVQAFTKEEATTTPGPTDMIGCVRVMAQHLAVFGHEKTTDVVIWGNAVQTAAPVNLADPVQRADPKTAMQAVISRGLLPDCTGWRVYMVGGSLSSTGGLATLRDEQLREFWREFFARCGGRLVLWDTTLPTFPAHGAVAPARWTHRKIIIPLSASVLFAPNQAALLPGAGRVLGELASKLRYTYPSATAKIAGYTAAVSGPGPKAGPLSQARAQAVAAWLEAHGVPAARLSARGYGDQDQIATDATAAGRALNRRVIVTLYIG